MNKQLLDKTRVRDALEKSWSAETSACYSKDAFSSYGQCAQTAILIYEFFGGEILCTTGWHGQGRHFYNRINNERIDFTSDQFEMPNYSYKLTYDDRISSIEEALEETLPNQVNNLRRAFLQAYNL